MADRKSLRDVINTHLKMADHAITRYGVKDASDFGGPVAGNIIDIDLYRAYGRWTATIELSFCRNIYPWFRLRPDAMEIIILRVFTYVPIQVSAALSENAFFGVFAVIRDGVDLGANCGCATSCSVRWKGIDIPLSRSK